MDRRSHLSRTLLARAARTFVAVVGFLGPLLPSAHAARRADPRVASVPRPPVPAPSPALASTAFTLKWEWNGDIESPGFARTCATPVVVQLTDDDGNGTIDSRDMPDVVFSHGDGSRTITALDGATGRSVLEIASPLVSSAEIAAGDLDGDGLVEIVALDAPRRRMLAFRPAGTFREVPFAGSTSPDSLDAIAIADIQQDGTPDVYVAGRAGIALDLVHDVPGLEILRNDITPQGLKSVTDLDGDGEADIVVYTGETLSVRDHLGAPVGATFLLPGATPSAPPVIADLDADGAPEIFLTTGLEALALEWSAGVFTVKWRIAAIDVSGYGGATAFDLDGDGAAEILYRDEDAFLVLDGRTGAVVFRDDTPSATGTERPIVADIDGDGGPEIVVGGCQGPARPFAPNLVRAWDVASSVPTRAIWNQATYHACNVDDDGSIPRLQGLPWREHGTWMSQRGPGDCAPGPEPPPLAPPCADCAGLLATVASAEIDVEGVRTSFTAKANAACAATERWQLHAARGELCALLQEVAAQAGQHVTPDSATAIAACVSAFAVAHGLPADPCARR